MSLRDTLTSLFRNQRGSMQTATKTRTSTSTRTKVLLTLGVLGIVAAAAYGYAFAPGVQLNRLQPVIRKTTVPTTSGVSTSQKLPTGTSTTTPTNTTSTDRISPTVTLDPTFSLFATSTRVSVRANFSDNVHVVSCRLFANYINVGTMNLWQQIEVAGVPATRGRATFDYTFPSEGRFPIAVDCMDAAGNPGSTGDVFITITDLTCKNLRISLRSDSPSGIDVGGSTKTVAIYNLTSSRSCNFVVSRASVTLRSDISYTATREIKLWANSISAGNIIAQGNILKKAAASTLDGTYVLSGAGSREISITAGTPTPLYLTVDTQDAQVDKRLQAVIDSLTPSVAGTPVAGNTLTY